VLAVLILTLVPTPSKPGQSHVDARFLPASRVSDISNIVENVVLFMPLGAGCALRRWTLPGTTVFGCILSASVELVQLVIPGRFCGPRDVVTNTAGAALGHLLAQAPVFRAMVDRAWPLRDERP
jgi:glycopeptide antibiotics resistance protein